VHRLRAHELRIVGLAALGYGGLELVEGVGLWLDQLWAEYLTVIATSLLIPFALMRASSHSRLVRLLVGPVATIAMGAAAPAVATLRWWSIFVAMPALAVARVVNRRGRAGEVA